MSDERSDAPVVDATDEVEIGLEAPERGSAAELMDHGAGGELGPMRHSAAHVLAEAVMDLFPGTKLGIGPVIDDGFYYDLLLPRPLTPDDLPAIEARMRESIAADYPFELSEMTPEEARAFMVERDQPFKVEIIDDLLAAAKRDGTPDAADDLLPPGPVHRPVPRPARGQHRQDRSVQAARHGRCVLARRREAPDAPAHLRHRLGDPGAARRLPVASRGGEEARPSTAGRPARPVQLPRRLARLGLLAPQGPDDLANARGRDARAPGATRATRRSARRSSSPSVSGGSPATGTCTRTTCSSSSPRTSCSASSR